MLANDFDLQSIGYAPSSGMLDLACTGWWEQMIKFPEV